MGNRFQAVPWKLPTLLPLRETWMQGSGWEERGFRFEFSWSCFPGKESICNAGDTNLIRRSGRSPGEGNGNPLQYSCLGKSHGQRNLPGYRLWGCKRVGHNFETKQQQQSLVSMYYSHLLPRDAQVPYIKWCGICMEAMHIFVYFKSSLDYL